MKTKFIASSTSLLLLLIFSFSCRSGSNNAKSASVIPASQEQSPVISNTNTSNTNIDLEESDIRDTEKEYKKTIEEKVSKEIVKKVDSIAKKTPVKIIKQKSKTEFAAITFDSMVHRLPAINEGEIFNDKFRFTNTGKAPLSIIEALPSCGCTLPSYPFIDIPPGEEGFIEVTYNSVNKEGPQDAEITIKSNTLPRTTVLSMEFEVLNKEIDSKKTLSKEASPN